MIETIQLTRIFYLFTSILVVGSLLLLPLYKFDWRRLVKSSVFLKTMMWVPLFAGFMVFLYASVWARAGIYAVIGLVALHELLPHLRKHPKERQLIVWYYVDYLFAGLPLVLAGLVFETTIAISFLVTVCFASVLSDVVAFFFGNYLGKHHLPKDFNDHKSWEGVLGQFVGALLGVSLLHLAGITSIFWLWIPIGIGSTAGDLANSYVKRRLGIKDWGQTIPGHGGVIDRFCSLFGASAFAFIALVLSRV